MIGNAFVRIVAIALMASPVALASKVGDVATGKILSESDTVLSLQVKPCSTSPETLMFSAPWKKRLVASRKCPNGQKYDEYQVEQSAQFSNSTSARIGDVADGLVAQQTDDSVTLNATPCQTKEKAQFIVFSAPFKVRATGEGACPDGNKYKKSSVEQLSSNASSQRPDWQAHIAWAAANHDAGGSTDCPDQYLSVDLPACVVAGGRTCLMAAAVQAANAGNCAYAFRLTLITQCHNASARQALSTAGEKVVCSYLRDLVGTR
jgi:hypothetical protein